MPSSSGGWVEGEGDAGRGVVGRMGLACRCIGGVQWRGMVGPVVLAGENGGDGVWG